MGELQLNSDPRVEQLIQKYPERARTGLLHLRQLILTVARESDEITQIEETLRWGEPSFLTKYGSTIRIDWKEKNPEYITAFFKCTSKLVPAFRAVYGNVFVFEKNRGIHFKIGDKIPEAELKHCFSMALRYHKIKHLPLLGAQSSSASG